MQIRWESDESTNGGLLESGEFYYKRSLSVDDGSVTQGEKEFKLINNPVHVEIPRHSKLFRVLIEREIGIDWEHSHNSSKEPLSI